METSDEAVTVTRLRVLRGEILSSEEWAQPEFSCCGLSPMQVKPKLSISSGPLGGDPARSGFRPIRTSSRISTVF